MVNYFISTWPVKNPRKEVLDSLERGSGEKYVVRSRKTGYGDSGIKRKIKIAATAFSIWTSRKKIGRVIGYGSEECVYLALLNRILPVRKMKITMSMFIFNHSSSGLKDRLKVFFYRLALYSKRVENVVVHSNIEVRKLSEVFPKAKDKFKYVPVGVNMPDARAAHPKRSGVVFSAGRDNRDYDFLIDALNGSDFKVEIVCHWLEQPESKNIRVLHNCFWQDTIDRMASADVVVIPLKEDNPVSSGQTVFLQAMHLGIPVIVTDIPPTRDYIKDSYNGLLIKNNAEELTYAITRLQNDGILRKKIVGNARERADSFHTIDALIYRLGQLAATGSYTMAAMDDLP